MQEDLDVQSALHEIELDVLNEDRLIASIACRFEATFSDLHYVICQKIHLHPKSLYRFYIPRMHMSFRSIPRSKDLSSDKRLLSILTVGDDLYYQNNNQKLRLKIRGIGEEIDKINIERDLRRAYVALEDTVAKNTYVRKNHVQRENLTLLYGLASDLLQKQIHRLLADQTSLVFNLKGNHLIAYCLVTQTRDQIEYFFFPDQKSFSRYLMVKQDAYISNIHKEKYKDGFAMVLSKKQLKETELTKPYNSQMYVEHSCYTYFYDVQRGYEVDVVNNTQAKEFMRYLVALQKALAKIKTFQLEFVNTKVSLYIGYNPHTKSTLLQSGPKPFVALTDVSYTNYENIEKLQLFTRTIDTLELDYFLCMKKPLAYKDERARYLVEGVCMGRDFRRVKSEGYDGEEQISHMMIDLLLDAIEASGLPQKVLVRERAVYAQIHDFCDQLGIIVEVYARLPKIDAFHQMRIKK